MATEGTRRALIVLLALALVVTGGAVYAWLVRTTPEPPRRHHYARTPEVAIQAAVPVQETVPVVGHGTVRPTRQVKVVPQVSGELVHVHDDLATGKFIPKGALLFEIDPTVYEARVRQVEAEVQLLEAGLDRADQELASLDARIGNAEALLAIAERDYQTSKRLHEEENVGTQRDVDLVHQKFLSHNDALIELKSRRAVIPHTKRETSARLDAARARLKQARYERDHTKIYCPFDARVEQVAAYASQAVTAHFSIATLTDRSAFELPVGVDPRELRWLDKAIRPEALQNGETAEAPEAVVEWTLHDQSYTWRGRVTRFERVDEATRTARLIVEVRDVDMVAKVGAGSEDSVPTLSIGMHCRVQLPVEPIENALLIPRHAIHENRWVYVFEPADDAEGERSGRLGRRTVPLLRSMGDSVLVDYAGRDGTEVCELKPGELVVVSPLNRHTTGMLVRLREDQVARGATPESFGKAAETVTLLSLPSYGVTLVQRPQTFSPVGRPSLDLRLVSDTSNYAVTQARTVTHAGG
ncbi:MAG: hypothetical protein PVI86_19080 [Phycisphaerae bacterium]|jgi:multidrug efflux pump subunit AcrA (membrane-fusion protein)